MAAKRWVCARSTVIWKAVMAKAAKVLLKLDRFGTLSVATRFARVRNRGIAHAAKIGSLGSLAQRSRDECAPGRTGPVVTAIGLAADRLSDPAAPYGAR